MSEHEGFHPEYFEELCALAASGQIGESEFVELERHMQECDRCRAAHNDFEDLVHYKLPLADPEVMSSSRFANPFSRNSSYRERFFARARTLGLELAPVSNSSFGSRTGLWFWPAINQVTTLALLVSLTVVGVLGYSLRQSNARIAAFVGEGANEQNSSPTAHEGTGEGTNVGAPRASEDRTAAETRLRQTESRFDAALHELRAQLHEGGDVLTQRENELKEVGLAFGKYKEESDGKLQEANLRLQSLSKESSDSLEQFGKDLADAKEDVRRIKVERDELTRERDAERDRRLTLQSNYDRLSRTLDEQTASMVEYKQIGYIHNLLSGPKLFSIEASFIDGSKEEYAHVLYSKDALIVYAYLGKRVDPKRKEEFQVWGARRSNSSSARSLGILSRDARNPNIWILAQSVPAIMSGIDEIFVSAEPPGSKTPKGEKLFLTPINAL